MGWISRELSPLSQLFVEFCGARETGLAELPVLDVGAATGVASLAALRTGARVIANDIDEGVLGQLWEAAGEEERERLTIREGRFPHGVDWREESLAAVHASNVFHFLAGDEVERGLKAAARWLAPGGQLFLQASTPYQAPFEGFLNEYAKRVHEGRRWPGWIEKLSAYSTHRRLGQMPRSIHLLDDQVLLREAVRAGFRIERIWLHTRPDLPGQLRLDGRETVALIAQKTGTERKSK